MVIGKTTGKGYDLLRVVGRREDDMYVMSLRAKKPEDEPLWYPSFIDKGIWEQSALSVGLRLT